MLLQQPFFFFFFFPLRWCRGGGKHQPFNRLFHVETVFYPHADDTLEVAVILTISLLSDLTDEESVLHGRRPAVVSHHFAKERKRLRRFRSRL